MKPEVIEMRREDRDGNIIDTTIFDMTFLSKNMVDMIAQYKAQGDDYSRTHTFCVYFADWDLYHRGHMGAYENIVSDYSDFDDFDMVDFYVDKIMRIGKRYNVPLKSRAEEKAALSQAAHDRLWDGDIRSCADNYDPDPDAHFW